jgi:hypothetical protein
LEEEDMFWNKIVLLLSAVARYWQDPQYYKSQTPPKTRVKAFRNQSSKEENATSDEARTCEPKRFQWETTSWLWNWIPFSLFWCSPRLTPTTPPTWQT